MIRFPLPLLRKFPMLAPVAMVSLLAFAGCQPALQTSTPVPPGTECEALPWSFERATVQGVLPGLASNLRRVDTYRLLARGELLGLPAEAETQWFLQVDSVLLPAQRVTPSGGSTGGEGWVATRYHYADGADAMHQVEPVTYMLHGREGELHTSYLVAVQGKKCWRAPVLEWTVLERILAE